MSLSNVVFFRFIAFVKGVQRLKWKTKLYNAVYDTQYILTELPMTCNAYNDLSLRVGRVQFLNVLVV